MKNSRKYMKNSCDVDLNIVLFFFLVFFHKIVDKKNILKAQPLFMFIVIRIFYFYFPIKETVCMVSFAGLHVELILPVSIGAELSFNRMLV